MASLIKKLAGETVIYGISHMLSRILFFVALTPYLSYKLNNDTSEYGVYSLLYSYSTILLTIFIFRLDTALFRYGSKGDINKVLGTALIPILAIVGITLTVNFFAAGNIASLIGYPKSPHYVRWFVYIICLDVLANMIFAKLRLESKPVRFMVYKLFNVLLTLVLVVIFFDILPKYNPSLLEELNTSLGMKLRVDYVFLANLIASAATLLIMFTEYLSIRIHYDKPLMKKMLWYAAPLVVVGIAGSINQTFSTPIQRYFLGEDVAANMADAGVYAMAAKLAILLQLFTTAFNYAAEPFFFKNADRSDSTAVYGKVALMYTIVACLGTLAIVSYLDIIVLMLGESYRVGAPVVPFLLFAYILLGLYYNVSIWYKLKDKTHIGAVISILGMVVTIAVSISILPKVGTIASAYAAVACYAFMVIMGYFIGQKYYPVEYPVSKILTIIGSTAILCYAVGFLKSSISGLPYFGAVTLLLLLVAGLMWVKEVKPALK